MTRSVQNHRRRASLAEEDTPDVVSGIRRDRCAVLKRRQWLPDHHADIYGKT